MSEEAKVARAAMREATGHGKPGPKPKDQKDDRKDAGQWEDVGGRPSLPFVFSKSGEVLVGIYRGFDVKDTPDPRSKKGETRESLLHYFDVDAETYSLWGSYDLDSKLTADLVGKLVRVTFKGKIEIGGGQELKQFLIQVRR